MKKHGFQVKWMGLKMSPLSRLPAPFCLPHPTLGNSFRHLQLIHTLTFNTCHDASQKHVYTNLLLRDKNMNPKSTVNLKQGN